MENIKTCLNGLTFKISFLGIHVTASLIASAKFEDTYTISRVSVINEPVIGISFHICMLVKLRRACTVHLQNIKETTYYPVLSIISFKA